jgi:hypothetical protein
MLAVTQSPHSNTGSDRLGALSLTDCHRRETDDGLMKYAANVCLGQQQANGTFLPREKILKGHTWIKSFAICKFVDAAFLQFNFERFHFHGFAHFRNDRCGDEVQKLEVIVFY